MFIELFAQVKAYFQDADVSFVNEHVAYEFCIVGENGGIFYLEVKDGKLHVEPYEYIDRDAKITTSSESVLRIAKGELDPIFAHNVGLVNIVGDMSKVGVLKQILEGVSKKENKYHWIPGKKYINVSIREDGQDDDGRYRFVFRVMHKEHQSYGQLFRAKCNEDFRIEELPGDVYAEREGKEITFVRGNQLNDNGLTDIWVKISAESKPEIDTIEDGIFDLVS
ncbi:MAG: SCP2 sterol-binding domain-containing protein [Agathobacter sp.]|nr:SCP2 sterol-binding domain-containing protein [Agathobacter sp.]